MIDTTSINTIVSRKYLPAALEIKKWEDVEKYFNELLQRPVEDAEALWRWMSDRSELESVLQEDLGWRYIRMSCDTASEEYKNAFNFFVSEIQPRIAPVSNELDKQLVANPFINELKQPGLEIYLRQVRKRIEIYRDENIPLIAELQQQENKYKSEQEIINGNT